VFRFLQVLWLVLSIPLVFVGAYYGFRAEPYSYPVSIGAVPRQIPEQQWYLRPLFACLIGGILPYGSVFLEIVFIMGSLWMDYYYYVFGFLLLVFIILVITCAEIAIVLTYFHVRCCRLRVPAPPLLPECMLTCSPSPSLCAVLRCPCSCVAKTTVGGGAHFTFPVSRECMSSRTAFCTTSSTSP